MLHTVEGIFNRGNVWPPVSEHARLTDISDYSAMFSGDYAKPGALLGRSGHIFNAAFERTRRDDMSEHIIGVNLFRFAIETHLDLMFGEESKLRGTEEDEEDALHEWSERERLFTQVMPEATADAMRAGDGYIRCVPDAGEARLSVVSPDICFPVVARDDVRKEVGFVIAWKWNEGDSRTPDWRGIAEVHEPGGYYRHELTFDRDGTRVKSVKEGAKIDTGYDGLAIVHVVGANRPTNCYHGVSVLADIDGIVAEIEVRLAQIARILDKHADPSMNVPETSATMNPSTGQYEVMSGSAFVVAADESPASYMTWDGGLEAAFKAHDTLVTHYCRQAHIARVLFDPDGASGVTSGAAWKRAMSAMLSYAARWRQALDPVVMEVARIASAIEGFDITKLDIEWADGLPDDPLEIAQTVVFKRQAGVQSVESGVAEVSGKSGEALTAEVEAIRGQGVPSPTAPPRVTLPPAEES